MPSDQTAYPRTINLSDGREARIHKGHDLDPKVLTADLIDYYGEHVGEATIEEVHYSYSPRIKNCAYVDGHGCDADGEWHPHWFPVAAPNDTLANGQETRYTLAVREVTW